MSTNHDSASSAEVTPALLKQIAIAFNSRDTDRIVRHFAEDATFLMASGPGPCGRVVSGREQIRQVLADRFRRIPDMRWEPMYSYIAGERAVSVWRVKGESIDGTSYDHQGCDLWEFKNGLVTHKDTYWKFTGS